MYLWGPDSSGQGHRAGLRLWGACCVQGLPCPPAMLKEAGDAPFSALPQLPSPGGVCPERTQATHLPPPDARSQDSCRAHSELQPQGSKPRPGHAVRLIWMGGAAQSCFPGRDGRSRASQVQPGQSGTQAGPGGSVGRGWLGMWEAEPAGVTEAAPWRPGTGRRLELHTSVEPLAGRHARGRDQPRLLPPRVCAGRARTSVQRPDSFSTAIAQQRGL